MASDDKKEESRNQELYDDILAKVKDAEDIEEKKKILDDFSDNYMMPSSLWEERYMLCEDRQSHQTEAKKVALKAFKHFDYNLVINYQNDLIKFQDIRRRFAKPRPWDLPSFENGYPEKEAAIERMKFLHYKLEVDFMNHQRFLTSHVSPRFLEYIKKKTVLYKKLTNTQTDAEQVACLAEINEPKAIKHTLEKQIGLCIDFKYNTKEMWEYYLDILRGTNPKEMLQVYSKYCRYYMDDIEMKEKYAKEVEKYGPVYVGWKNPFEFETFREESDDDILQTFEGSRNEIFEDVVSLNFENIPKFSDSPDFVQQDLPFHSTTINYLFNHCSGETQEKFNQTCKQFFIRQQTIPCYRLSLSDAHSNLEFIEKSVNCNKIDFERIKEFRFCTTMVFDFQMENLRLSDLIKNVIFKCDAKFISLRNQNLRKEELEFLVGNVEDLRMQNCQLKQQNGASMKLEEILEMTPKIKIFGYDAVALESMNTLSNLNFVNKIEGFAIRHLTNEIDFDDFYAFLEKNSTSESSFCVTFSSSISEASINALKNMLEEISDEKESYWISININDTLWFSFPISLNCPKNGDDI